MLWEGMPSIIMMYSMYCRSKHFFTSTPSCGMLKGQLLYQLQVLTSVDKIFRECILAHVGRDQA